jgi:hypothetical protein
LTHIAKALIGGDIVREGRIIASELDDVLGAAVSFFFYGRPAYRVHGDGAVKTAAACPFLFVFNSSVIDRANAIHPFDTGAFKRRLYSHVMMDEMELADFSLERDSSRVNRLIARTYGTPNAYFNGDTSKIPPASEIATPDQFLAQAYIDLITSAGRNEPDDRVSTLEVTLCDPLPLKDVLLAVVIPDILWNDDHKTHWLEDLARDAIDIIPFKFFPGRSPDYYMQSLEVEARKYYQNLQIL